MKNLLVLLALLCPVGAYAFNGLQTVYKDGANAYILDTYSISRTGDSVSYVAIIVHKKVQSKFTMLGDCATGKHGALTVNGEMASSSFKMEEMKPGTPSAFGLNSACAIGKEIR